MGLADDCKEYSRVRESDANFRTKYLPVPNNCVQLTYHTCLRNCHGYIFHLANLPNNYFTQTV